MDAQHTGDEPGKVEGPDLLAAIAARARVLGFSQIGVADVELSGAHAGLEAWLAQGFQGSMAYMARSTSLRASPAALRPGTLSVITARMDYLPRAAPTDWADQARDALGQPQQAVVSIYARGRDYHKVLRSRLVRLAQAVEALVGPTGHRVFTDSAPVMEAELAVASGIGWRGKHTLVLARDAGSMFFLGEIFVDRWLPRTASTGAHCGQCTACIDICPTQAIVAPQRLDSRRCISYLSIEHDGAIDESLRPLMGNRIYGCDDCQWVCPWNKFAQRSTLPDFDEREGLHGGQLIELMRWSEAEFLRRTEGSAIRRIGHARWLRNVATALGNALRGSRDGTFVNAARLALAAHADHAHAAVREHVRWALQQATDVSLEDF